MAVTIHEMLANDPNNKEEQYRRMLENFSANLRVAAPGVIQSFDSTDQTVTVQVAIREKITNQDLTQQWVEIPLLLDVPIIIPRSGGYALTLPVSQGDECLVVFGDMCIDAWFSNGGIQNQMEKRRHDLSDAFAILGVGSQPNKIPNYSTDSAQLRSMDGSEYISLNSSEIKMVHSGCSISIGPDGVTIQGKNSSQSW